MHRQKGTPNIPQTVKDEIVRKIILSFPVSEFIYKCGSAFGTRKPRRQRRTRGRRKWLQGGKLLGTATIMEQAVEAAKGYAVKTCAPVHVTGYRDDGQQKQVICHHDGRIEKIWELCQSQPFEPTEGEIYRNAGGGAYLCRHTQNGGSTARMVNVKSGWEFIAHGLCRYFDGSLEWDCSIDGCFGEEPV